MSQNAERQPKHAIESLQNERNVDDEIKRVGKVSGKLQT